MIFVYKYNVYLYFHVVVTSFGMFWTLARQGTLLRFVVYEVRKTVSSNCQIKKENKVMEGKKFRFK